MDTSTVIEREYSTLREWAYAKLRDMIVSGELAPGEDIHEGRLCARLNLSKSPLREALRQLAQEGLIELTSNKGCRVAALTAEDIDEIFSLRRYTEALVVRRAAERVTPAQTAELRANIAAMEECRRLGDVAALAKRDVEFHLMLARISGHRRLLRIQESIQADVLRVVMYQVAQFGETAKSNAPYWHSLIVDALEAHDPDRAEEAMRDHIQRGQELRLQFANAP